MLEDGKWRVDASTIDLYAQDTPRHTISGLHPRRRAQALRHRHALRARRHKEGLDAAKLQTAWEGHEKQEIEQVLAGLKQALPSSTIEETGERATMPYGAGDDAARA